MAQLSMTLQGDVVIVGAGLGGLGAALALAQGGARVVVLDARGPGDDGFSRGVGLALIGTEEHPHHLAGGLGVERAAEYVAFTRRSVAALAALGAVHPGPTLRIAFGAREEGELDAGDALADALGLDRVVWSQDQVAELLRGPAPGAARASAGDLHVNPAECMSRLREAAISAGVDLRHNAPVLAVEDDADGVVVLAEGGLIARASLMVYAAGWAMAGLEPWLWDKLSPVRTRHMAAAPRPGAPRLGATAQYGHLNLSAGADGALRWAGLRWATPHLEVGETDEAAPTPAIDARLDAVHDRTLAAFGPKVEAWSVVHTHTCDNLPLVGPLPGQPRRALCLGFRDQQGALALESGRAIARGILGEDPALPSFLSPSRLV
ncbi:MAG: FAD-binding oxidoreductase [Deltaproteobacteria bacterium]|nr:FAD-binding oxidoreductase [Deltaproteobacteria bacterium]